MDAQDYFFRGVQAEKENKTNEAIANYTTAVQLGIDPNYGTHSGGSIRSRLSNCLWSRGSDYLGKKDYDNAIADLTEATRINEMHMLAYDYLGSAYLEKGNDDEAIKCFENVAGIAGAENNRTWRGFAEKRQAAAYLKKSSYDEAVYHYGRAIEYNPNDSSAYEGRASAYEAKGDMDLAKADYAEMERLQKKAVVAKKRNLIIKLVIAAAIIGLIIKCMAG
jgi:tetratricopeptide (TPR) repeat protein